MIDGFQLYFFTDLITFILLFTYLFILF